MVTGRRGTWVPAGEQLAAALEDGTYALTRAAVEGAQVKVFMRLKGTMQETEMAAVKWSGGELKAKEQHTSNFGGKTTTYVAYYANGDIDTPLFRIAIFGVLAKEELERVIAAYKMMLEIKGVT